ncbi:MAG: OmpA family protein, partial [Bacteroidota bacterium]
MKGFRGFLFLTVFSVCCYMGASAQQVEFRKENFPGREKEFAVANQAYLNGIKLMRENEENYFLAKSEFEKAWLFNPDHAVVNYYLGICYLRSSEKYKAKSYFQTAYHLNNQIDPHILFYLASCYQLESVWDSALIYYNLYEQNFTLSKNPEEWNITEKRKQESKNGLLLSLKKSETIIKNLGPGINTAFAEYTPYITTDEKKMFFTSRREGTTGNNLDAHDGLYFEDIYISDKVNNEWMPAVNAGTNINTRSHDAVCGIFPDGHTMIIFKGNINGGDLFYARYENGEWSRPLDFGNNINTEYHESSACLSSDGKKLLFVSDRPGGFGGRDIYESNFDVSANEWGEAVNLGKEINTVFDEEGVFLHPDGKTLFFASNGLQTIGGYDIMKSSRVNGAWTTPVNLGIPVNTPDDDVFVSVSGNGKNIYLSSNRKGGYGEKDIYMASVNGAETKSNMFMLTGEVLEEETGKPIEAHIDLIDLSKNEKIGTYDNDKETGKYVIPLPAGVKYGTVVYTDGYLFESENVEVSDTASYAEIKHVTHLRKIESGLIGRMNNIFFETGKATILPTSSNELDRIAAFLTINKTIKIEIQGHTDNVGDEAKNMLLSTQRAEAVYLELLTRKISPQRLSYKGFGESQPAADNATEAGRKLNRRIEFGILE